MDKSLGRNDSWSIRNICPPCLYKTENESPLKYQFLASIDGNNSLKLVDSTFRAGTARTDSRSSSSPRWITPDDVDTFKDEVKSPQETAIGISPERPPQDNDLEQEEIAWLNLAKHNEVAKAFDTCVERWRNAGPESRKKMYALFAIAGIFIAVCRHGHALVICDMIRSGELYVHT